MRKLPIYVIMLLLGAMLLPACSHNDNNNLWDAYSDWREKNEAWLEEAQARTNPDGTKYYQVVIPSWNPNVFVLMHFFNDRSLTAGNLTPMYTSTVDTRYTLHYYNDEPIDSSTNLSAYGPGIFRTQLNKVITGWAIAFENMHVGDSAEIVIPYNVGYGASTASNVAPYSNLKFHARLVDIYAYEVNPAAL